MSESVKNETIRFGMVPDWNVDSMVTLLPEKDGRYDLYNIDGYSRENFEDVGLLERYFSQKIRECMKHCENIDSEFYVTRKTTDFSLIAVLNCLIWVSRSLTVYFWDREEEIYRGTEFLTGQADCHPATDCCFPADCHCASGFCPESEAVPCVLLNRHNIGTCSELNTAVTDGNIIFSGDGLTGENIPDDRMFDFRFLSETASASLQRIQASAGQNGKHAVRFYLCGLKPLTVIAVNEARKLGFCVECMHWNMDRESYFPQNVVS